MGEGARPITREILGFKFTRVNRKPLCGNYFQGGRDGSTIAPFFSSGRKTINPMKKLYILDLPEVTTPVHVCEPDFPEISASDLVLVTDFLGCLPQT